MYHIHTALLRVFVIFQAQRISQCKYWSPTDGLEGTIRGSEQKMRSRQTNILVRLVSKSEKLAAAGALKLKQQG